jgi:hexosaminidase
LIIFFHIGGDEVIYGCWKEDPNVINWLNKNKLTLDQLMQLYENNLSSILMKHNKKMIAWEEIFTSYNLKISNNSYIIQVWKNSDILLTIAKSNFQCLLSYGWYLNQLDQSWEDFYLNEPFEYNFKWTPSLEKFVIGGEAAAWSEIISYANLDQVIWPRTAATAERLWSPRYVNNTEEAIPRLNEQICRLNKRGIMSGPIQPGFCY